MTFTRALISNFNKKLGNNDIGNKNDKFFDRFEAHLRHHENEQKWISELNMNVHYLDAILDFAKLTPLISQSYDILNCFEASERTSLIPLVQARQMPLFNIEIERAHFILPASNKQMFVYQLEALKLTSQVENPLIRTFPQNIHQSSSQTIYDRAKSNGLIYRPGFIFEDRQYLVDFKNAFFLRNNASSRPIIDRFSFRAVLALPIVFDRYLINGYLLEISIGPQIYLYASDMDIRSMEDSLEKNISVLKAFSAPTSKTTSISTSNVLQLVPVDFFLTCENLNVFLTQNQNGKDNLKPFLSIELTQPYVSLIMHEKAQKLEVSLFDIEVRNFF